MTLKTLKGHTSYVFCVNYNNASNLLVSGGCEGEIRIWNVDKGVHSLSSCTLLTYRERYREVYQKDPCTLGLCHRGSFQPRRLADRLMRSRWSNVSTPYMSESHDSDFKVAAYATRLPGSV